MKNARIAFVVYPHATHVNPTLPIVSALARRGHSVTYVTSERFAPRVEAAGARALAGVPVEPVPDHFCRMALHTLENSASLYEQKPDLMIYDLVGFAGRVLAQRWGIPAIRISPHFAFERSSLQLQVRNDQLREWALLMSKSADIFLRSQGVDSHGWIFQREGLNIHTFPREFEPSLQAVEDERCFYAGRCAAEAPYYGQWKHTDFGRPIALVSTSTTDPRGAEYFRICIAALADLGWHVILSIGDIDPAQLGPLPPHYEIVQGVSHTQIYPYIALVIFVGGTTSSAEAAYHGVPSIVTSNGNSEHEGLGDNIESLGFGRHVRKNEMSAAHLRKVALDVTGNGRILDNMQRLMRSVRTAPGGEETANRIESYLDEQWSLKNRA